MIGVNTQGERKSAVTFFLRQPLHTMHISAIKPATPHYLLHDALHARGKAIELLLLERLLDRVHGLRHDFLHLADQVVSDLDDKLLFLFVCVCVVCVKGEGGKSRVIGSASSKELWRCAADREVLGAAVLPPLAHSLANGGGKPSRARTPSSPTGLQNQWRRPSRSS